MILNKARFSTDIGHLHYLWKGSKKNPEVAYLGTASKSFYDYIKKINTKDSRPINKAETETGYSIILTDKKSLLIEKKIKDYLKGKIGNIELKTLFIFGTEFEKKVWRAAAKVPFGKTSSYGKIAEICGRSRAYRAVGNIMGKNPVLLLVPCHRIIKSDGSCCGFSAGPDLKKKLLELEGIHINQSP